MHFVQITFSDSRNDQSTLNLEMDDDMRDHWLTVDADVLAGLGVEKLAYNLGDGKPYTFRNVAREAGV